ncbi:MAG: hypothetical protein WEB58_01480 [Planctomycetaceae bacterium]
MQTLLSIVREGIAKQQHEIEAIYAVPPFLSKDLLFEHHDLRKTYARLIEQQLLEQPQILVVEFAEAEALMRERSLDVAGQKIRRLLPHYLLGEYRNEGKDEERRVTITLTHKHGEQERTRVKKSVHPDDAAMFLRQTVADIVERQTGKPSAAPDSKREAEQLLARAKEYLTLGDYEDAAALAEGSLLLEPEQVEPHVVAIRALTPLVRANWWYGQNTLAEAEVAMAAYLRGVDHLVGYLRSGGKYDGYLEGGQTNFIVRFLHSTNGFALHGKTDAGIRELIAETLVRNRTAMMKMFDLQIATEPGYAGALLDRAMTGMTEEEQQNVRLETILKYQDQPNAREIVFKFSTAGYALSRLDTPLGRTFLEDLEERGNDTVKTAVAELRMRRDEYIAMRKKEDDEAKKRPELHPIPEGGPRLGFEPLKLTRTYANGTIEEVNNVSYWLATDDEFDIICTGNSIYLMREPGVLEHIWGAGWPSGIISQFNGLRKSSICYDGRYIWIALSENRADDRLLVLDPESGERHELTDEQGFPNPVIGEGDIERSAQLLSLAPVGPGKIIVTGGFGRSWIGEATFDEKNGAKIDVFHEAPEIADRADRDQWRSTKVGFPVSLTATLHDDNVAEGGERKVLVMRGGDQGTEHLEVGYHPLIVDPSSNDVSAFEQELHTGENIAVQNGALYQVRFVPPELEQLAILRIGLPGPSIESVLPLKESGYIIADGNKMHIVGKQWWIADLESKSVIPTGRVPWIYDSPYVYTPVDQFEKFEGDKKRLVLLARSNHYGIVACYFDIKRQYTISQVTFTKPTSD